ncbi:MAG: alpha/beta hydrolase [Desulfobacterales bacterium]
MKNMPENAWDLLDRPEITRCLFHPRSEELILHGMSPDRDIFIPVKDDAVIGACFHMCQKNGANILFFHGNGEIVADYQEMGEIYNRMGINFLAADYRGYGRSTGSPSVSAMMRDSHTIFAFTCNWLKEREYTGPLIVMGRSLGSASALELAHACGDQMHGLIVESGFAFAIPLLRRLGVPFTATSFEEKQGFANLEKIRNFDRPVLIIHAAHDHIIPFSDGQTLYDACGSADKTLLRIPGADHNTLLHAGFSEYMKAVKTLAEKAELRI